MATTIALDPAHEDLVRRQLESGRYEDARAVVEAGLYLLEQAERRRQAQLEALRTDLAAGLASGPDAPAEEVFETLQARYRARVNGTGQG